MSDNFDVKYEIRECLTTILMLREKLNYICQNNLDLKIPEVHEEIEMNKKVLEKFKQDNPKFYS